MQTRTVLLAGDRRADCAQESEALHRKSGRSAGNGSLMRTTPVALAYLNDEAGLVATARSISGLTHYDPETGDACVLWCTAIRHAVLTGRLDVRIGLEHLDADRRQLWEQRLDEADNTLPSEFSRNNGWVVAALQGAWSAISVTPVPEQVPTAGVFHADHLRLALEAAVRGDTDTNTDTDTVAAIAGGLLGAVYGASAVPSQWRMLLSGWPGLRARGRIQLVDNIIDKDASVQFDYIYGGQPEARRIVRHPHDDKVWIGGVAALHHLPDEVDAVVSLWRVADSDLPTGVQQLDVWLIDREAENPNRDFGLFDTVRAIEQLRAEGHTVFVNCVEALSHTPAVAALYGARNQGIDVDDALSDIQAVLHESSPTDAIRNALRRLAPTPPLEPPGNCIPGEEDKGLIVMGSRPIRRISAPNPKPSEDG